MPYKRKNGRKARRRRRRQRNLVPIGMSPLPNKFVTKLRYCEQFSLNPGAGTTDVHVFRANGLYDPNITGVGHQPRGWDQLIAMYNHCTVIGSKITASFNNASTTDSQICGVALRDDDGTSAQTNDYIEQSNCVFKVLAEEGGGLAQRDVVMTYTPKKFLGIGNPLSATNLRNNATSNANEEVSYHVFMGATNAAADPFTSPVCVCIDYIVVFQEPKDVAQS